MAAGAGTSRGGGGIADLSQKTKSVSRYFFNFKFRHTHPFHLHTSYGKLQIGSSLENPP